MHTLLMEAIIVKSYSAELCSCGNVFWNRSNSEDFTLKSCTCSRYGLCYSVAKYYTTTFTASKTLNTANQLETAV